MHVYKMFMQTTVGLIHCLEAMGAFPTDTKKEHQEIWAKEVMTRRKVL